MRIRRGGSRLGICLAVMVLCVTGGVYGPAAATAPAAAQRAGTAAAKSKHRTLTKTPLRSVRHQSGRVFALTIDDGPSKYTRSMLAVLKKHHVHATFCLIGYAVRAYPSRVRSEVAAGHRLCDHTDDHDLFLESRSYAHIHADIAKARTAIRKAKKSAPIYYYRSPGGAFGPKQERAALSFGMQPLSWDVDPTDWRNPSTTVIYNRLRTHLHPGAIILIHDGGGFRKHSVAAVDRFLTYAAKHHFKAVFPD